jgi:hypothetical protein
MQGTSKRQVNAEELLAELKRVLESSTSAPNVPPPSALTISKSSSVGRESRRSQIDKRSDRPIKANADNSIGQPSDIQKSAKPSSRSWKLTAGGLALAGAATICANFALMNKTPNLPKREFSVVATEGLVRPQNEQTLEPSSDSRSLMQDNRQAGLLQVGNLETRPDVSTAPANSSLLPAVGEAEVDAPHPASFGLESTAPAFMPAPPNPAATPGASQMVRPDGTPIATVPSSPASTDSAPLAETPKSNAMPTAHVSNESARPSPPKIGSTKRPLGKTSLKKPAKSAKVSAKPVAQVERRSTLPARPKEPESSPQPAQDTGNPTAVAPVTATTIEQRFADGMTHAFSYMMHLPGALVPHPADPNADAH